MKKQPVISTLERIERNKDGKYLTHHQVTVLAYGILSIFDDIEDISSLWRDEVELFLKMLTKRVPHHARCILAEQAIKLLRKGSEGNQIFENPQECGEVKKSCSTEPENF